jgi:hypothetical protein
VNLRYAVLCERLQLRATLFGLHPPDPPTTEEQLDATEQALGFALSPMLRALYLEVGNGGSELFEKGYEFTGARPATAALQAAALSKLGAPSELEQTRIHAAWRLPNEIVAALRQQPGLYVRCDHLPDGLVQLFHYGGELILFLDGFTGYLYLRGEKYTRGDEPLEDDFNWHFLSFFAPSVEDWLERELDAIDEVKWSYFPKQELTTLLAEEQSVANRLNSDEDQSEGMSLEEEARETHRLRRVNLGEDGQDPRVRPRHPHEVLMLNNSVTMAHIGWKLLQARHQLLRELYALMDVATEQAAADDRWGDEQVFAELRPLIEAEAHLADFLGRLDYSKLNDNNRLYPF